MDLLRSSFNMAHAPRWRYAGFLTILLFLFSTLLPENINLVFSASFASVGQMADKRFGLTVTGSPAPAALHANLAFLGNQRTWYSFDQQTADPADNRQRVQLVRTGTGYPSSLAALQTYVQSMPTGTYWMIGNEPNVDGQDDVTPTQYATQYETLKNTIRSVDPTARMVGPNFLNWNQTCTGCGDGFPRSDTWTDQMLKAYRTQTGHEIDFDVWGIHTYGITWTDLPMTHYQSDISQVQALRTYLNTLPAQAGKPIWITEFGIIWGYSGYAIQGGKVVPTGQLQRQAMLDYLSNYMDWLLANAGSQHIDRWFLYTSYGLPEPYASVFAGISLFDGTTGTSGLTDFGQLYHNKSLTDGVETPTNLTVSALSKTQIHLSWTNNASNQTGYQLDRKVGSAGSWSPLATLGAGVSSYNDNFNDTFLNPTPDTPYFYRVQAFNSRVNSDYSNEASQVLSLNAPTNLTLALNGSNELDLSWTDNSNQETNYSVERQTGVGGTWQTLDTLTANQTSYQDSGLAAGTVYFYRVRAYQDTLVVSSAYAATPGQVTPVLASQQVTSTADNGLGDTPGSFSYALQQAASGSVHTVTFAAGLNQINLDTLPVIPSGLTIAGTCDPSGGPALILNAAGVSNRLDGWVIGGKISLFGLKIEGTRLIFKSNSNLGSNKAACIQVKAPVS